MLSKYVGDRIFEERYDDILPCVYVGLALHEAFACLLGIPFCLWEYFVGGVDAYYVITGFFAYAFLGLAFDFMLYLSILKLYRQLSLFFFFGMLLTFLLSLLFRFVFRWAITYSMLAALALGFFLIAVLELGFLKTYFHDNSRCYREVFGYFGIYWKLMLSNFFYVLGLLRPQLRVLDEGGHEPAPGGQLRLQPAV